MKKQFDRFVLTELIAQGVGGDLYNGEERLPGGVTRPARVKVLPQFSKGDPGAEARFVEEIRVLASLAANPHVVTFYGMGITEGVPWIALEHAPDTLDSLLGPSPGKVGHIARMIEHVASALSSLHHLQPPRLHNRLSPATVLAFAGPHFKVTEFGLASPVSAEPTLSSDSVRYAAPELISPDVGPTSPATDLYALGHIAYEMALGAKLHRQQFPSVFDGTADVRATNPAKWQAWHHSMPTVLTPVHEVVKGFPQRLSEVISRLTSKQIGSRYASADDVLIELGPESLFTPSTNVPNTPSAADSGRSSVAPRSTLTPLGTQSAPVETGRSGVGERFFVRLRNQISGPYDLSTLQRLSRQGQVSRLHQVSTDQRAWKSASTLEGLFA